MIGFGDLDFAASNRPAITTVSVDRHAIGERAATLLADRIEGGEDSGVIIDIGFQLVATRIGVGLPFQGMVCRVGERRISAYT
ncbi:transcriptional regulator [Klebsiella variicola]|uniref:Transcriptional regulator n=1 Tax=Klebsiella variicola TaxID=244366 RepID=A0A7H4ML03_KLEVA|nr:transcriptional regulator [Klebsiella variicola]